jgi:hypothetical protein
VNLRALVLTVLATALALAAALQRPVPAQALSLQPLCTAAGAVSKLAGTACTVASKAPRAINAGKKLLGGHVGGALKALAGGGGGGGAASAVAGKAAFTIGLAAVGAWVAGGAHATLKLSAALLAKTTRPQLTSTWFSASYWRVAGIGALLTLPFLFAAAVQAVLRGDLTVLSRSVFAYLPLSLLVVCIAAPLTMLLLSATDAISSAVASAAHGSGGEVLGRLGGLSAGVSFAWHSPFVVFFVGILVVTAGVLLWLELLMREAAIYVVVLMLPLVFAGMVWPARRVWATRAVEVLVALILSKFAIVAVLSLGGAALGHSTFSAGGMLIGLTLVTLAAAAPWALVRLLPMAEVASSVAGHLRTEAGLVPGNALARMDQAEELAERATPAAGVGGGTEEVARSEAGKLRAGAERSTSEPQPPDLPTAAEQVAEELGHTDTPSRDPHGEYAAAPSITGAPAATAATAATTRPAAATAETGSSTADPPLGSRVKSYRMPFPDEPLELGLEGQAPELVEPPGEDQDGRPPRQESEEGPL